MKKLSLVLIFLFGLVSVQVSGQKLLRKANKQYRFKHYAEAIETYKEFLQSNATHLEARTNLADCYRMSNDLVEASKLYEELVKVEDVDSKVIKNYGLTLMKMGDYSLAKNYFQIYKVYNPQKGNHYDMSCDFATKLFANPTEYDINLLPINTESSDFGVSFYGDKMIFSSFRNDLVAGNKNAQALNGNILYIADVDDNLAISNVKFLRSGISERVNIGPVSYSEEAGVVIFARNKVKDGGSHVSGNDNIHSLFVAEAKENGDWQNERPFRYNEFGTSTAFPSLAFDGTALYFASNRVGGYGGYDIYVSYYEDNEWTYPENLGPTINTSGNEITPFFDGETLYFSSDYIHGMGGYDIFSSTVDGGKWKYPTNLGNGVNSPGDDYYPMMKRGSEVLLFSSNRLGGKGMDDVYAATPMREELLVETAPIETLKEAHIDSQEPSFYRVANIDVTTVNVLPTKEVLTPSVAEEKVEVASADNPMGATQKPAAYDLRKNTVTLSEATPLNLDISKARRVAINELLPANSEVYFIQLASLYSSAGNVEKFSGLKAYGNIYKMYKSNSTKIKLGYFYDKSEANSILAKVKTKGYRDAFITKDDLNSNELELVVSSNTSSNSYNDDYSYMNSPSYTTKGSQYKIRLASYEDPIWFDITSAKHLGQIEQWTKGGWTIFILGGFSSYEEAESARIRAINKGFTDAEIVLDNNGILERLRTN